MAELPWKIDTSISVEQVQKSVGTQDKPIVTEVEKGFIKKYLEAVGDNNPLWQDPSYARQGPYGTPVAPPYIICGANMMGSLLPNIPRPREKVLDGGAEWEFLLPINSGDTISAITRLANITERELKGLGKAVFFIFETTHINQKKQTIAKSNATIIYY